MTTSGVNFTKNLRTACTHKDPKSTKKTDGLTVFFGLLASAHVKAARKMLVKSTPEPILRNFTRFTRI